MVNIKQPPTIADVAQRAGVSTATVSRVLNGTAPVAVKTAQRVQEAIRQLAYVPQAAARGLASRRTETLGLLLPEIGGAFFSPLLRGIEAEAQTAGFDLLIHATSHRQHDSKPASYRPLGEHNTDGLIVFTQSLDEAELSRFYRLHFPIVLLYQTPPAGLQIPSVNIENRKGAREVVEHLIRMHQRRRIVYVRGPEGNQDSHQREKGYREALEANGIQPDESLVVSGNFNEEETRAMIAGLLQQGIDFDAVFGGDDEMAAGAISALAQAGKRVPEEVAVAGFDDLPAARYLLPALTTVRAPIEQVGRKGVRQLVGLIRGQPVETLVSLPTELVVRESCGCSNWTPQEYFQDKAFSSAKNSNLS